MLPTITILGRELPTYGVLSIVGVVLALALMLPRCRRFGLSADDAAYLYAFALVGALVGAKGLYLLTVLPQLAADFHLLWQEPSVFMERYLTGGMVFYGGFIGGVLGAWGASRYFRLRFTDFFPVMVPALPLVHAVGRLGCFSVGCCYGVEAPPPLGIAYQISPIAPNGVPLFPVQLWECGAELVIFAVLLLASRREGPRYRLLILYALCYAPVRFVLEFFRGDSARGGLGPLSTSQWISLAVLAGILIWQLARRRARPGDASKE